MKALLPAFLLFAVCFSCSRSGNTNTNSETVAEATDTTANAGIIDSLQVPGAVIARFNYLFPKPGKVTWEMEENDYEATFPFEVGEKSVLFTPEGEVISSETDIQSNSLPEAALNYISQNLNGKKIEEAEMITTATGSITYEIEAEGKEYLFDGSGNFIKIEEEEAGEKD